MKYYKNKIHLFLFLFLLSGNASLAQQGVCINCPDNNPTPSADAIMDIRSANKGILFPRLASRPATPSEGLMIYNTTSKRFELWDGTDWKAMGLWTDDTSRANSLKFDSHIRLQDLDILGLNSVVGENGLHFYGDLADGGQDMTILSNGKIGIGNITPETRLSFANELEQKISLWDGGANDYGLGVSSFQFNYHVGDASANHVFYAGGNNGDGTELMRIKGNGNVGIGTSSPTAKLHVNGVIRLNNNIVVEDGHSVMGNSSLGLSGDGVGTDIRITASGDVGVGTSNPVEKLQVQGNAYVTGQIYSADGYITNTNTGFGDSNWRKIVAAAVSNNDAYFSNATFAAPSDRRFKKDIQPLESALQKVQQLSGVSYQWNEKGKEYFTQDIEKTVVAGPNATPEENQKAIAKEKNRFKKTLNKTEIGFIAQEVEAVLPELIETKKDGFKGVKYGQVTALLVEAMKEQQATIEQQQAQLEQQGMLINGFEARLSVLENSKKLKSDNNILTKEAEEEK